MTEYFPPELNKDAFNCPYCGVYAHQTWYSSISYGEVEVIYGEKRFYSKGILGGLSLSICYHCGKKVLWHNENMLLPRQMTVPEPSEDVPQKIKKIYIEAGKVLIDSARASGALMRLALEQLLQEINKNDLKLNENVKKLMEIGVPDQLIKALTILRVNGNDIMHTGEIKILQKKEDVLYLFELFNMIVEELITRPKRLNESYGKIPETIRKQIEDDANKNKK